MSKCTVIQADVSEWAENYDGPPFQAMLGDPPYHLTITDRFGGEGAAPAADVYGRFSGGFMGATWDGDHYIAFRPATWQVLLRHLEPGGFLMACGGSRTDHHLAVAIEQAGAEIVDKMMWLYFSGFPKSHNLDKALDRAAGLVRRVIGRASQSGAKFKAVQEAIDNGGFNDPERDGFDLTLPEGELAQTWSGYGTALKPAYEPVIVARKPRAPISSETLHAVTGWDWWHTPKTVENTPAFRLSVWKKYGLRLPSGHVEVILQVVSRRALHAGVESDKLFVAIPARPCRQRQPATLGRIEVKPYRPWSSDSIVANALASGAGTLNIDGGRVMAGDGQGHWGGRHIDSQNAFNHSPDKDFYRSRQHPGGRWPANVLLSHAPGCRPSGCVPGCPVRQLTEQTGELTSGFGAVKKAAANGYLANTYGRESRSPGSPNVEYGDSGSGARFLRQLDWSWEIWERLQAVEPMKYQPKVSPLEGDAGVEDFYWRRIPQGFERISRKTWERLPARERARGNIHPTKKPIALMKYLATLLLPPPDYPRRLLVPFGGSGDGIGPLLAGWDEVVVIEQDPNFCDIHRARVALFEKYLRWGQTEVETILAAHQKERKARRQAARRAGMAVIQGSFLE